MMEHARDEGDSAECFPSINRQHDSASEASVVEPICLDGKSGFQGPPQENSAEEPKTSSHWSESKCVQSISRTPFGSAGQSWMLSFT